MTSRTACAGMARMSATDPTGPATVDAVAAGAAITATTNAVATARGLLAGRRIADTSARGDRRMKYLARPQRFTEPRRRGGAPERGFYRPPPPEQDRA